MGLFCMGERQSCKKIISYWVLNIVSLILIMSSIDNFLQILKLGMMKAQGLDQSWPQAVNLHP